MTSCFVTGILVHAVMMAVAAEPAFPPEMVRFTAYPKNPLFEAAGPGHWDQNIRERGWIMKEGDEYHLWYTGYVPPESNEKHLGYATSKDGLLWTRYPGNPIHTEGWVEDVMVVKEGDTYYMFAEGRGDQAHMLSSTDRIHWTRQGTLDIRKANGEPIAPGPFGTPSVLRENGRWYLFYERNDEAVWIAASDDLKTWKNVQDEPVIRCGPEPYDRNMIAVNQVVKYQGCYYAYYHAICPENGHGRWSMNVAASTDLLHWKKYPGNPIVPPDHSSGILVPDGAGFRLYCLHPSMALYLPETSPEKPAAK